MPVKPDILTKNCGKGERKHGPQVVNTGEKATFCTAHTQTKTVQKVVGTGEGEQAGCRQHSLLDRPEAGPYGRKDRGRRSQHLQSALRATSFPRSLFWVGAPILNNSLNP